MNDEHSDGAGAEGQEAPFATPLNRRDFVFNAAKLTAAAAAAGPFFMATKQAAAAELASTSATAGDPIAVSAVTAAKQYSGQTVSALYEAGLQALDPKSFSGPLFEKLTGVKTAVVEAPFPTAYTKSIAEHLSKSGAFDVIDAVPGWVPDLADRGVIAPLDEWVSKYKAQATFADIHPLYRAMPKHKGKTWGFFDDGDMYILYYRKDIFADAKLKSAYKAKFKQPLRVPQSWAEFNQTAQFITDQMGPKVYGTALLRAAGNGNWYDFYQTYRNNGGSFFDPKTMNTLINGAIGVKSMQELIARTSAQPPGVNKLDAVSAWATWLQGKSAMMYSWPPTGRMSENISQASKSFSFVPKSKIVGKVGYAVIPGKNGEMAGGYVKCVSADSKNVELAYLNAQWMTSPSVSLQRVMLPYALRDPYRISHYKSAEYRALWPAAKDYLIQLNNGANNGVVDLLIPGAADYDSALDRAMTGMYSGQDVKKSLDAVAKEWDKITQQRGVDAQRAAYTAYLTQPGATRKNTVAARGQAVKVS